MKLKVRFNYKTNDGNWYLPFFVIGGNKKQFSVWLVGISFTLTIN
jgi:hypothetical protein